MTHYINYLTTINDVQNQLEKADPGTALTVANSEYQGFVTYMRDAIPGVSQYIERYTKRVFVPYTESKSYRLRDLYYGDRWTEDRAFTRRLALDEDLLVTNSITWNGTALSASAYEELPSRESPYHTIEFDPDNTTVDLDLSVFSSACVIAGVWGYHDSPSQMYTTIETVTLANDTVTTITVTDASLYKTYQYVLCESELMLITSRNETTDVLTVTRGVNGTTAAAHAAASLKIYTPVRDIHLCATRLAAWAYQHRNDLGEVISFQDGSTVVTQVPSFVKDTLDRLIRYPLPMGN